jgi:hypothetical protein
VPNRDGGQGECRDDHDRSGDEALHAVRYEVRAHRDGDRGSHGADDRPQRELNADRRRPAATRADRDHGQAEEGDPYYHADDSVLHGDMLLANGCWHFPPQLPARRTIRSHRVDVRRLALALVALMLLVSISVAMILSSGSRSPGVGVPSSRAPSVGVVPSRSAEPSPIVAGSAPFAFGEPDTASPMPNSAQSRLWFNDGSWWGVFLAEATADQRIYRLDVVSQTWSDTGIVVDDRVFARMDVLWDGEALVVASAGPQPEPRHALVVSRFTYDESTDSYRRDANFPVPLTRIGVDDVTIARAVDGVLWVAYVQGGRMAIDHSVGSDLAWNGSFEPPFAGGPIEEVAIASIGEAVAVVWTPPSEPSLNVAWHDANEPSDAWRIGSAVTAVGLGPGTRQFDLTVDPSPGAERLFVVTTTGVDALAERGRLDGQVLLIELSLTEEPRSYLVGRIEDQHADPIVLVNSDSRELYVVAAAPKAGGGIYYKVASLDDIQFAAGVGRPLIPASDEESRFAHPSSTKQALDAGSGLVVAATDSTTGRYGFATVSVGSAGGPPSPSQPAAPLIDQTFDGLRVGGDVPGWIVDGDPPPAFEIRVLTGSNSSARLSSTSTDARACIALPEVSTGVLRAEIATLVNIASNEELHLLQLRGPAGELASVRLREGEVVYATGASLVRSDLFLAPGRWYRSALTLDLAAQTYRLEIRNASNDTLLLEADGLAWRSSQSSVANRLCVELPSQPELDLYLDDVLVTTGDGDQG